MSRKKILVIAMFILIIILVIMPAKPIVVNYDHMAGGDVRELIVYFSSDRSGLERHHYMTCSLSGDVAGYDQPSNHGLMVLGVGINKLKASKAYEAKISFVKSSDTPPYYVTKADLLTQFSGKNKIPCVVAESNYFSPDTKSKPFFIPVVEILSVIKL
ncbi:hypothetical protein [Chromobacterium subtsugae]|uniref:hypothetical protein n=1 Tax=Chromobacterium subtsugae TaxID=251747 RepID=UPI0012D398D7|nr:hypothetical protein [Chromobacterium subtsugae]